MNEKANTHNAKAEAARINRKLVRARSRRRVALSSFALFALVFTLLSFRLTAGLDPSSSGTSVATTGTPSTQSTTTSSYESEDTSEPDDDDTSTSDTQSSTTSASDSSSSALQSSSAGSTTSAAPTTRAS